MCGCFAFLLSWALTQSVQATLVDQGNSLLDSSTGLEWLDLTATVGQSVDDVLVGGFGGFAAAGYGLATIGQVEELWTNAGFTVFGVNSVLNRAAGELIISLMGCTDPNTTRGCTVGPFTVSSTDRGTGIALRTDLNIPLVASVDLGGPGSPSFARAIFVGSTAFDSASDVAGIFLVRDGQTSGGGGNPISLPEPNTILLVLPGLLILLACLYQPIRNRQG